MNFAATEKRKKVALYFALFTELMLLGLTKYWNPLAQSTGIFSPINILIPLGISFYTFQSVGYIFDVYRGKLQVELNFPRYALFLSFFPHLLAGPIEPAQHFLPQIQKSKSFEARSLAFGIILILAGLFKKLVIADRLGPIVNLVFDNPKEHFGLGIAFATLLARYQIYCDFSGYTDIAIGSAMMFGFKLTENFNRPFFSSSISEYWRRWHMSLSTWIRNYIFYPLIISSASRLGFSGLIIVTFLALGLWHGGSINFLLYGLLQGVFIVIDAKTKNLRSHFYQKSGLNRYPRLLNSLCIFITFFFIIVPPTLFFRSTHFDTSVILIKNLASHTWSFTDLTFIFRNSYLTQNLLIAGCSIVLLEFADWIQKAKYNVAEYIWSKPIWIFCTIMILCLILILIFGKLETNSSFIYTQF
ncbi:MAG: MBOAT family O-acyltransferase [Bacteriovorax sp.]